MMTVEIWSDLVCPFCYIGKRNFESALARFKGKDAVRVVWKSFELDPSAKPDSGETIHEHLSAKYGVSLEEAKRMTERVEQMAAHAGLHFAIERTSPTNTFDAHRLVYLAQKYGLQAEAQERLFVAYFTEGKRLGDKKVLAEIGRNIGLAAMEVSGLLEGDNFAESVRADEEEARKLGINSVPCFLIDRRLVLRGAQPVETFQEALETATKG